MAKSDPLAFTTSALPLSLDQWTTSAPVEDLVVRDWLQSLEALPSKLQALESEPVRIKVLEQCLSILSAEQQETLHALHANCLLRELELRAAGTAMIYVQLVIPDATLRAYPWLAELADSDLDTLLEGMPGITRGEFEFSQLSAEHGLAQRAQVKIEAGERAAVFARRRVLTLNGHALLVQEVFLPTLWSPAANRVVLVASE